jgi:hypothetical protein
MRSYRCFTGDSSPPETHHQRSRDVFEPRAADPIERVEQRSVAEGFTLGFSSGYSVPEGQEEP